MMIHDTMRPQDPASNEDPRRVIKGFLMTVFNTMAQLK